MNTLTLPAFDYQLIKKDGKTYIFDILRKKYIHLTPEEWVRQHIVHYLINYRSYRPTLMTVERSCGKLGRADILIYNANHQLHMLVECKAPTQRLNLKAINQVSRYNMHVQAPFMTISNGITHLCFEKKQSQYKLLKEIPVFCTQKNL